MGEFVEVDPGSVILLDREQIKKLSYIVSGKEGEEPYFLGVLRNGRLKQLDNDYVHENFPEELIHRCMQEGTKPGAGKKFFHTPQGHQEQLLTVQSSTNATHWQSTNKTVMLPASSLPLQAPCTTLGYTGRQKP